MWFGAARVRVSSFAYRFHVYVSNRAQKICNATIPSSWLYINTVINPADHASRGLTASELLQGSRWLTRPFLPQKAGEFEVKENDPELKKASVLECHVRSSATQSFE